MNETYLDDERIVDLLAQRATEGLSPAEVDELERLLAAHPAADREALERVAAALALAGRLESEPLPAELEQRLRLQGESWLRENPRPAPVADLRSAREARATAPAAAMPRRRHSEHWGWWVAAAAVLIAVVGWYPRIAETPVSTLATVPPAELRRQLIETAPNLVRWSWAATEDESGRAVQGDVVWDPATQSGYMRFVGLPANDARQLQYQLWIFDAERDDRFPVDGGVFDVPAGRDEVVVPIDSRLPIARPVLFAVTVEKPGGVVVSSRERIVALAQPGQA